MIIRLLFAFFMIVTIQASHALTTGDCGKDWVNLHKHNDDLLGVYVQQYPDGDHEGESYDNKHPAMIIYVFNNALAHQVEYTPSGQVKNGFWFDAKRVKWLYNRLSYDLKLDYVCSPRRHD